MKKKILTVFLAAVMMIGMGWNVHLRGQEDFDELQPLEDGEVLRLHRMELVPREDVEEYLVTGEEICLFYDEAGLLNAYSMDGDFLYGLQVETSPNGKGEMAWDGECLYISSRGSRYYIFDGSSLVRSFTSKENWEEFRRIRELSKAEPNHRVGQVHYTYNAVSNRISRFDQTSPMETVIQLPQKAPEGEYLLGMLLSVTALCGIIVMNNWKEWLIGA